MQSGLLDGRSSLDIQLSHPAYQTFNPANFLNNVSCLQSKLGLVSLATVSFALSPPPQVPHVPSHSPLPSYVQPVPCFPDSQGVPLQAFHYPCLLSLMLFPVGSQQCIMVLHPLGTDDDCFHPSGHLKLELPYIMDEWSDGEHSFSFLPDCAVGRSSIGMVHVLRWKEFDW